MYGFFSSALEKLIRRRFGDDKWEEICELAEVSLGDSHSFQVHQVYDDKDIHSLLKAASDVLGFDQSTILEMYGEQFLLWCQEYWHSGTLKLLGRSLQDFITNLHSLFDHVSTIYPHIACPSFRCAPGQKPNEFFLHSHAEREGMEHIAIGFVKAISQEYFKMEVKVQLLVKKGENNSDHTIFSVQEVAHYEQSYLEEALRSNTPKLFSEKQLVSPEVFCKSFPFHIIFDRNLDILQCGATMSVLLSSTIHHDPNLASHFLLEHPIMKFSFNEILTHINTFFVLHMSTQVLPYYNALNFNLRDGDTLSLRGQMVYIRESDAILFLCSPRVKHFKDLEKAGLYLSDIPLHDATRGLLMLGQAAESEFESSVQLEELIVELQSVQKSLEEEKQRMAGLLREMLPLSVADSLMAGRMVEAERFESVTILFSDIVQFTSICSKSEPMEIVNMLNKLYSCFDQCVDQNQVYKVETIGDAYMVVGGLPQRSATHAECVANQALDMMYYCRRVCRPDNGKPITMRIGIHSGKVVAGIVGVRMPRYCLFGNTVNIASRAESNGVPGRIQVTEYTYNLLKQNPQLSFTYRGPVEFKNVPEPIPCYFLLENSAKSQPTPVSVSFSEDLVPGYDLATRPTPFSFRRLQPTSPPTISDTKYSSLLTVPPVGQDISEAPPIPSLHRPLSCSSASSTSTLQSRDEMVPPTLVVPDISAADDPGPLQVAVPHISVTSASSSPSPIHKDTVNSTEQVQKVVGLLNHLKQQSAHIGPFHRDSDVETDESNTPESPFVPYLQPIPQETAATASPSEKKHSLLWNIGGEDTTPLNSIGMYPFTSAKGTRQRFEEGMYLGAKGRQEHQFESLSSLSQLREEGGEDSLYSSFDGSEMSDPELEEKQRRLSKRREGQQPVRGRVVVRRNGETVRPRLLKTGHNLRVSVIQDSGVGGLGNIRDRGHLDRIEDGGETIPVRKISDCSSRSVDSGTKMSDISKDEEDGLRKLTELSEASQNDSEMEEERGGGRGGAIGIAEPSHSPLSPDLPPLRGRSGSVHNKIDFFNRWLLHRQESMASSAVRKKLLRTQSEVIFSELTSVLPAPRRGSMFPNQEHHNTTKT